MSNPKLLLAALTLDEKIKLLGGTMVRSSQARDGDVFGIERVGMPPLKFADGPVGVHWWTQASTCYPALICLAATMDAEQARAYGSALGDDCRAVGIHVLLAPGVNLYRSPLCGRNFEYLGEDPELSGQLAAAYIRGIQSRGVAATVKHFAANNQEYDRHGISSDVDERTLREVYLRPFERAVKEGGSACLMTAYGLLNGQHCSENSWLTDQILRGEWGFDGWVISDWTSVHSTVQTLNSGLDLEMPWGRFLNPAAVHAALASGLVSAAKLDEKILNRLQLMARFGWLNPQHRQLDPAIPSQNPASEAVALDVARRGMVLLKNDSACLPARPGSVRRIAVLGHHAQTSVLCGGGSSYTRPYSSVTLADALAQVYGPEVQLDLHACVAPWRGEAVFSASAFFTPDGQPGLAARYFEGDRFDGAPATATDDRLDFLLGESRPPAIKGGALFSAIWNGEIVIEEGGGTDFYMDTEDGYLDACLDGEPLFTSHRGPCRRTLELAPGRHAVEIRFRQTQKGYVKFRFGYEPAINARIDCEAGLTAAAQADLVIVAAGFVSQTEGESHDRDFEMDARLVRMIEDAAAVSSRIVVALYIGGAVQTVPWLDKVQAALCLWYPGQNGTLAAAEIIAGLTNPSGKLPFTWEKQLEDRGASACYQDADGDRRVSYDDGIFIGHRHFDRHGIEPRFPFGHGLSYTTFAYENLRIDSPAADGSATLRFDIRNTGKFNGTESAMIFVAAESSVPRPVREFKASATATLAPGERQTLAVTLPPRAFAFWHPDKKMWVIEPGEYTILVGPSAKELPLQAKLTLRGRTLS
ncbi:MAG: glycoside hydrolase family 3 N-terminal domain-containing protein [Verrucomicrobiae bacterium]